MALAPVVALEIGTTKTVALVGELREDANIMITGMGEHPTTGVRKGEIIDFENTLVCVRSALQAAEDSGQVTIRRVHLTLSGGHIQSIVNRGTAPVQDPEEGITSSDVNQVMNIARAINLPPDREILHTICQHFYIDDEEKVIRPEGMEGARLSVDMLALFGTRGRLRNTIRVVRSVPMEVDDVAFSGLCAALAVLTADQKESGVLLIDLGGGTTNYVVYADSTLAAAGAIGVGGDHVTNDIALGFAIPHRQAERLKRDSGSALVDQSAQARRISLPEEVGFPARVIRTTMLQTVIHARMHELLSTIKRRLQGDELLHHIGAGVVLTGGGALLKDATALAEQVFGLPCMIGTAKGVSGLASALAGPEYAAPIGLVRYAFRNAAASRPGGGMWGALKQALGFEKSRMGRHDS